LSISKRSILLIPFLLISSGVFAQYNPTPSIIKNSPCFVNAQDGWSSNAKINCGEYWTEFTKEQLTDASVAVTEAGIASR
jgi:hypothetical protein